MLFDKWISLCEFHTSLCEFNGHTRFVWKTHTGISKVQHSVDLIIFCLSFLSFGLFLWQSGNSSVILFELSTQFACEIYMVCVNQMKKSFPYQPEK
jgi:hypothetical protein